GVIRIGEMLLISHQQSVDGGSPQREQGLRQSPLLALRTPNDWIGEMLLVTRHQADSTRRLIVRTTRRQPREWQGASAVEELRTGYQQPIPDLARRVTPVPISSRRAPDAAVNEVARPINYCYGIENRLCF